MIGLLVYSRNKTNPINISFALFCLFIALWVCIGFIWRLQIAHHILPILTHRMGVASSTLVITNLMSFTAYFPVPSKSLNTRFTVINYAIALIIVLAAFSPWCVVSGHFDGMQYVPELGPLYLLFVVYVFGGAIHVIYNLATKYRRLKLHLEKQKVKYVVVGISVTLIFVMLFMFILPSLGLRQLFFLGQITPIITVCFTAYAIIRYHALDISAFASRVLLWTLHGLLLLGLIFTIMALGQSLIPVYDPAALTVLAVVALLVCWGYSKSVKPLLDHLLRRKALNMNRLLEAFSRSLNQLKPMLELTADIERFMRQSLDAEAVSLILCDPHPDGCMLTPDQRPIEGLKSCRGFIAFIERENQIMIKEQITLDPQYQLIRESALCFFDYLGSELAVPLVFDQNLLGVLNLGKKTGDNGYGLEELQFLSIVRHDIGVAIKNSQLYQDVNNLVIEVTRLNETLEERVTVRTADLQEALSQLKHLDKLKSEFISIASHELRTPLTAVKGGIALVLEYQLQGDVGMVVRHLLEMSNRNIDRLILLINDILDLSKLEAAQASLKMELVDLQEIVSAVQDTLTPLMKEKNMTLTQVTLPQPVRTLGDRSRLTQVVTNLVGNAIKFSPAGSRITVTVKRVDPWLECSVSDEGDGIPMGQRQKIFERFSQIRDVQSKKTGTGLGLAISKKIIELHGGRIWVEGRSGKGSCFKFRIPLSAP